MAECRHHRADPVPAAGGALIPRIREISAAGASVSFGEQATRLADNAGRVVQQVAGDQADAGHPPPDLLGPEPVADPALVFLQAYRELEAAARDAGPAAKVAAPTPVPVIRELASRGRAPREAVRIAEELRGIRNEVAHGVRRLEPVDAENLAIAARSLAVVCRWAQPGESQPRRPDQRRLDPVFAHGVSLREPAGPADVDFEEVQ